MSLPTYAFFYNKDNEVIAKQFVNVGWWLTADLFVDAVLDLPAVKDAEWAELYGIFIEKKYLRPIDKLPDNWEEIRQCLIDSSPSKVVGFTQDSELRKAIQEVYNQQTKE